MLGATHTNIKYTWSTHTGSSLTTMPITARCSLPQNSTLAPQELIFLFLSIFYNDFLLISGTNNPSIFILPFNIY